MTGGRAVWAGRADVGAGPYGGDERGPCPPFAGELPAELTSPALAPPSRGSCPRSGLRGADVQRAVFICMDGERPPPALRATSPARGEVREKRIATPVCGLARNDGGQGGFWRGGPMWATAPMGVMRGGLAPPFCGGAAGGVDFPRSGSPLAGELSAQRAEGADVQRAVFTCMDGERSPPALRATSPARGEVFGAGRQGRRKAGAALGGPGRVRLFT